MQDIAEQLRVRDRIRKRFNARLTPEERLERMSELQAQAWQVLQQNPDAVERFWRRNLRQRGARQRAAQRDPGATP